ncbi:hypothetical protein JCM17380_53170 [Desulfosporosinus burensis]
MIDVNALEEQCPKCNGKGGIENTTWYHNWAIRNSKLHFLEAKDKVPSLRGGLTLLSFNILYVSVKRTTILWRDHGDFYSRPYSGTHLPVS